MNNSIEVIEELSTPVKYDCVSIFASAASTPVKKRQRHNSTDDEDYRSKVKKYLDFNCDSSSSDSSSSDSCSSDSSSSDSTEYLPQHMTNQSSDEGVSEIDSDDDDSFCDQGYLAIDLNTTKACF